MELEDWYDRIAHFAQIDNKMYVTLTDGTTHVFRICGGIAEWVRCEAPGNPNQMELFPEEDDCADEESWEEEGGHAEDSGCNCQEGQEG